MENTSENRPMEHRKHITIGLLAHVDAGKTTLSEAILYVSGRLRRLGRVDSRDAFLDTHALERARGITIFSKQAEFDLGEVGMTLLDTPGHVDFSAEMERTLSVLDCAVLVVSGADGIQGHTYTLWRLLEKYRLPVFVFVNKMDQDAAKRDDLLAELKAGLSEGCVNFGAGTSASFYEEVAVCSEETLEHYLEQGCLGTSEIAGLVSERKVFPCYFGSALKCEGVGELLEGISMYLRPVFRSKEFGARVYKISRDGQGNRLTHMKVTGGSLAVKTLLEGVSCQEGGASTLGPENVWREKVNEIRLYSGEKYEVLKEAEAGCVCAVTGLTRTRPGDGLGAEKSSVVPVLEPVLSYRIRLPEGSEAGSVLPKLLCLEEEDPQLHIVWQEELKEIHVQVMGEVQTEILKSLILERLGLEVKLDEGSIVYRETITRRAEGVGHYEPLRHYAEVHLLLEPGEPGSGFTAALACSEDVLDKNWQRLALTHLEERQHKGVLTGAPVTDIKVTLVSGKAHQKHTEGGDFRQAVYRALRQGLMQAESLLLEPFYDYFLEVPERLVGRAMTDIERMSGAFSPPEQKGEMCVLSGRAPVSQMQGYHREVLSYTGGRGRLSCSFGGYGPCQNADKVIEEKGYDALRDTQNPCSSVFCAHGAGVTVPWDKVKDYMHVEAYLKEEKDGADAFRKTSGAGQELDTAKEGGERFIGPEEVDAILARASGANSRPDPALRKRAPDTGRAFGRTENSACQKRPYGPKEQRKSYLLVDGYNVIFAWEDLKELAQVSIDGARGKLMDILCNYQAVRQCSLILVFDAYRVQGHTTENLDYHNIHVVYTAEAETADRYIERFAHENGRRYDVTVATSDGLEQIIIRGQGCRLLSARELREEIRRAGQALCEEYAQKQPAGKNRLGDAMPREDWIRFEEEREEH